MSNLEISRAQRLDQKVVELLPELSRAYAAKLVEQGKVTVNGEVETKAGYKLREGDAVEVDYRPEEAQAIPDIELPILYEDDDCVVINKPIGVLTHSKGAFNPEATVATWLRRRLAKGEWQGTTDAAGNARAGIVHRLDRATSGVMICAKTPEALSWLQKQFSQRRTKKTYAAVVSGHLPEDHAVIDMPIERNPKKPQTFRVGVNGKPSVTEYQVVSSNSAASLLELRPQTGRTHQLRVHLSHLGHPIVGDTLYGGLAADRLYLHAERLELTLPSRERKVFEAPVPKVFTDYLAEADS
ncbi:MAG TPA: RluA family pseudouridine synthase [Candidatus Saccharimonadales bacterium]|nr:RluA family pseudouridine synthase [Candidatus Saccharimonadales bacterium]